MPVAGAFSKPALHIGRVGITCTNFKEITLATNQWKNLHGPNNFIDNL
jgi:hypothetical protein